MTDLEAEANLRAAKRLIVAAVLGAESASDTPIAARLGEIVLRPHQVAAVARLMAILRERGGAVLADHVGLGKTYVALAVARHYERVLVVAPAALREMWSRASSAAGRIVSIVTTQALSRENAIVDHEPELVIVDEAHHLRSHLTRRYARLGDLCARAHVLLLSATPIQNRRADLTTELALFLGSRAYALGDAQLAELVVRRDASAVETGPLPAVSGPHAVRLDVEDDLLDELLALPTPFPAADEGLAGALAAYSLVHLWSSSRAALAPAAPRAGSRITGLPGGRSPSDTARAQCLDLR
jgi:hypothetical protein